MSRVLCQQCQKPEKGCICVFSVSIGNHIRVVVLQHPSEVKQSKGTVALLQQSLANCQVLVGENFADCQILTQLLAHYDNKIALLYPSEQAVTVDFSSSNHAENVRRTPLQDSQLNEIECIIVLDGTWKKAYRMFMLNPCLHNIAHIVLPQGIESLYQIRKTKKENALSSLEACCHALARLENNREKYQVLLNNFVKFNQFQQSFSPKAHTQEQ
ncbi:MAG: tRNA-uridine aminocarboxypropyltransferase [Cognaticolwellia sp.]